MSVVFAPTLRMRGGRYGNALLVRGDIERHEVMKLRGGRRFQGRLGGGRILPLGREPRNAILAAVWVAGHRLSVAATHLATQRDVSKKQLAQAVSALQDMPEPWVLMGDLNRTPKDVLSEPALGSMELIRGAVTFPAWAPRVQIDHIAIRGLTVVADGVRAIRSPRVSDHLALVVDVEFDGAS